MSGFSISAIFDYLTLFEQFGHRDESSSHLICILQEPCMWWFLQMHLERVKALVNGFEVVDSSFSVSHI